MLSGVKCSKLYQVAVGSSWAYANSPPPHRMPRTHIRAVSRMSTDCRPKFLMVNG